jgi:hypothetical protein
VYITSSFDNPDIMQLHKLDQPPAPELSDHQTASGSRASTGHKSPSHSTISLPYARNQL